MASNLYESLKKIEKARQHSIKNAKLANLPATDNMDFYSIGDLFLQQNNSEAVELDEEWVRPEDWWDTKTILENAQEIVQDGTTYYPAYIMLINNEDDTISVKKTSDSNNKTRGDAFVFSDEPETLYVGDTTHTWDKTKDKDCSEGYKTRYILVYRINLEFNCYANSTAEGIILKSLPCLEVILGAITFLCPETTHSSMILSIQGNKHIQNFETTTSTIFTGWVYAYNGFNGCHRLKQLNLINVKKLVGDSIISNVYNLQNAYFPDLEEFYSTGSGSGLVSSSYVLKKLSFPKLKLYRGNGPLAKYCYTLKELELPELETINVSGSSSNTSLYLIDALYALKTLNLPKLKQIGGNSIMHFAASCSSLTEILAPVLETISGIYGGSAVFVSSCYVLKTLYLPELKSLTVYRLLNATYIDNLSLPKLETIEYKRSNSTYPLIATHYPKNLYIPDNVVFTTTISNTEDYIQYLSGISSLTYLELPNWLKGVPVKMSVQYLRTLKIPKDWDTSLALENNNDLYKSSLIDIIDNLADVAANGETRKLVVGSTNLAKIPAEYRTIANNKGWTIS